MGNRTCPIHKRKDGFDKQVRIKETIVVDGWYCNKCEKIYIKEKTLGSGILGRTKENHIVYNTYTRVKLPDKFYVYVKTGNQFPWGTKRTKLIDEFITKDGKKMNFSAKYCAAYDKYYITLNAYEKNEDEIARNNVEVDLSYVFENCSDEELELEEDFTPEEKNRDIECLKETNKVARAHLDSKISYNPYQYLPWLYMFNENDKNILICDEVGLGKTIEAGILIKEQIYENKNSSILVICPAFLKNKWNSELYEKFNLDSCVFRIRCNKNS